MAKKVEHLFIIDEKKYHAIRELVLFAVGPVATYNENQLQMANDVIKRLRNLGTNVDHIVYRHGVPMIDAIEFAEFRNAIISKGKQK